MRIAQGTRDSSGTWHPDNPADYPPIAVHGIWPWSTLDQSLPAWKARKAYWRDIVSDEPHVRSHAAGMIATGRHGKTSGGVSTFDPVLTELAYTWFCPPHGWVLDPFAGGPTRGIVAHTLGYDYRGYDINPTQASYNQDTHPGLDLWRCGDGMEELSGHSGADYILTCPPYHNRERYTDLAADLSTMRWDRFCGAIEATMAAAWSALRDDRFMTWVVSDVRDHRGHLRGLPSMVDAAARRAGFALCNEQILIAPPGTRAKTTRPPWEACRTVSRRHQIVFTWVKGDRREATKAVRAC